MKITLKVWRQENTEAKGQLETYELDNVSEHMSFLEMMDTVGSGFLAIEQLELGASLL